MFNKISIDVRRAVIYTQQPTITTFQEFVHTQETTIMNLCTLGAYNTDIGCHWLYFAGFSVSYLFYYYVEYCNVRVH